jgi:hypothetical protein
MNFMKLGINYFYLGSPAKIGVKKGKKILSAAWGVILSTIPENNSMTLGRESHKSIPKSFHCVHCQFYPGQFFMYRHLRVMRV